MAESCCVSLNVLSLLMNKKTLELSLYSRLLIVEWIFCFREMKIYAKQSEQPKLDRTESEMLETEKPIFVKMNDSSFVKKFLDVLSLEEHKGRDKFRNKHLTIFKVRVCFRIHVYIM